MKSKHNYVPTYADMIAASGLFPEAYKKIVLGKHSDSARRTAVSTPRKNHGQVRSRKKKT